MSKLDSNQIDAITANIKKALKDEIHDLQENACVGNLRAKNVATMDQVFASFTKSMQDFKRSVNLEGKDYQESARVKDDFEKLRDEFLMLHTGPNSPSKILYKHVVDNVLRKDGKTVSKDVSNKARRDMQFQINTFKSLISLDDFKRKLEVEILPAFLKEDLRNKQGYGMYLGERMKCTVKAWVGHLGEKGKWQVTFANGLSAYRTESELRKTWR